MPGLAPCGTALTSQQIAALSRWCDLRAVGVLIAFDPGPPGRRAAVKAYPRLAACTATMLPAGCDPAQILVDAGPAALTRALTAHAVPLADLVIDAEADSWARWLAYPEGQLNALRGAAPLIAAMPPAGVARQVARLASRLGLDHATVTDAVTSALTRRCRLTRARRPGGGRETG